MDHYMFNIPMEQSF